jgi:hypothetical protein
LSAVKLRSVRVLAVVALVGAVGPVAAQAPGKLCFERGQAEGPIRKHPVRILGELDGKPRKVAELRGTKKVCASVPPGKWSLEARSTNPLEPRSKNPDACRSAPFLIDVPKGATVTVWVAPVGRDGVYHCGWELD